MPSHTTERTHPNVLTVRFDDIASGWEQWVRLSSDHHFDNLHCDRSLLSSHYEKVLERDALDFTFGDLFCAMQGKYDKRKDPRDVRPEHNVAHYLDAIVEDAGDFYAPYAKNMVMISEGNHESSIVDRNGTNLLSNLAFRLNTKHSGNVEVGQYSGWVRFLFVSNGNRRQSIKLYYHHGSGGGGPVTKGVIQTNRQAVYQPDANIVVNGHTHDAWVLPIARERLSQQGNPSQDILWFARTPTYKQEYGKGTFHDRTWKPPKPLGCVWARFYFHGERIHMELTPDVE